MVQRRAAHVFPAIRHQVVGCGFNGTANPRFLQLLLRNGHHQKFQQVPFAGHSLVEVLFEFASLEEAGRQRPIGVPQHPSDFNVLLDFLVCFKPGATQGLSCPQVDISSASECEQPVRSTAGRCGAAHFFAGLNLHKFFNAPLFTGSIDPCCI